jgi:hypothetical protein
MLHKSYFLIQKYLIKFVFYFSAKEKHTEPLRTKLTETCYCKTYKNNFSKQSSFGNETFRRRVTRDPLLVCSKSFRKEYSENIHDINFSYLI